MTAPKQGWAEAVATPDDDVGFVFTPLSAVFTGLPVAIAIGDDTPLVIALPQAMTAGQVAALRRWVVRHQAALSAHWHGAIDAAELIEALATAIEEESRR